MFYEYEETESKEVKPKGNGWKYWSSKITPEEKIEVWRRKEGDFEILE